MRTLENNPKLEYLLKEFVLMNYEESADISENSLIREYYFLLNNNQLKLLFELEEMLTKWEKNRIKDDIRTAYFEIFKGDNHHPS